MQPLQTVESAAGCCHLPLGILQPSHRQAEVKAAQRFLFALSKKPPHHTLERVGRVSSLFQQLAVLQLLAHPLQGVERLVELHGHLHFGELFADVVPEDVPQADVDLGAGGR